MRFPIAEKRKGLFQLLDYHRGAICTLAIFKCYNVAIKRSAGPLFYNLIRNNAKIFEMVACRAKVKTAKEIDKQTFLVLGLAKFQDIKKLF